MPDILPTPPLLELTPRPDLGVLMGRWHYQPAQQTKRWPLEDYYPDVARRFGQRLYVAYLFSPDMRRQLVDAPNYAPPEAYAGHPYVLDFFGDGGAAIKWLQAYQPATSRPA